MKYFLFFLLIFFYFNGFSQKYFIVCPDTFAVNPKAGFLADKEINVVFFDNRILPEKVKNECTTDAITNAIFTALEKEYPSAKFHLLSSDLFYKNPDTNKVTLKISLKAYGYALKTDIAAITGVSGVPKLTGMSSSNSWNSITALDVTLYDYDNAQKNKVANSIVKPVSKSNIWGKKDGEKALNDSFEQAFQDITSMVDKEFM